MGLYNTINFAFEKASDKRNKLFYYQMLSSLYRRYPYYSKPKVSFINKIIYNYKNNGLKNTIRFFKSSILYNLRKNNHIRFILRLIRLILKIILYIPKKIIQFILYV